jgi:hypothetical protein
MSERTQWVFRHPCGCPFGVLEGRVAPSLSRAWKEFYETTRERDRAMDRGVTVEHMSHDRYVVEVSQKLSLSYACPHDVAVSR